MQPLLKIQTIPIKIEAQTKRASLQHSTEPAPVPAPQRRKPVPQQRPMPQPQPRPQAEARPAPADRRVVQNRGVQRPPAAADNNGNYLQEASDAVQAYNQQSGAVDNAAVAEAAVPQSVPAEYQSESGVGSETAQSVVPASLSGYSMDRETFDWSVSEKPQLEYIPASIEYSISQYPEVVIEYVGEPIYVPASANPNYVPPPEAKGKG